MELPAKPSRLRQYLPVVLVVYFGIGLSVFMYWLASRLERERLQEEFNETVNDIEVPLMRSIDGNLEVLQSIVRLFQGSEEVKRGEFEKFTQGTLQPHPGIQALAWVPRVTAAQRPFLEKPSNEPGKEYPFRQRNEVGELEPAGPHAEYLPIYFLEPMDGNKDLLGLDLGREEAFRQALSAPATTEPVATGPFRFGSAPDDPLVCLVFLPIEHEHQPGYALVILQFQEMVDHALRGLKYVRGIGVWMYDRTSEDQEQVLYHPRAAAMSDNGSIRPWSRTIHRGGRQWRIACVPTSEYLAEGRAWLPWAVLGVGLLFTGLVGAYSYSLTGRAGRVEALVAKRTAELTHANHKLEDEIAERKTAERALRESEALYHSLVESLPQNIFQKDLESRFTFANQRFLGMLGQPLERITGKTDLDFFPPHLAAKYRQDDRRVLATGKPFETVEEHVQPGGEKLYVRVVKTPVWDGQGGLAGILGIFWNVTEEKQAERRMQAQYAVTRVLADAASLQEAIPKIIEVICECLGWEWGAVWRVDAQAQRLRCEEVWHAPGSDFAEFEGLSRRTAFPTGIGLPGRVWETGEPAWIEDVVRDTNFPRAPIAAREGMHGAFGFPIRLGNEVLGVIEFFSREIRQPDEKLLQMMGAIGSQIGQFMERQLAQEALRKSELQFRQVWESSIDGMRLTDAQGTVRRVNEALCKLTGKTKDELEGQPLGEIHAEEVREHVLRRHRERFAARTIQPHLERMVQLWNGRKSWLGLSNSMLEIEGEPPLLLSIFRDITDRKRAEETLRRTAEELTRSNLQLKELATNLEAAAASERRANDELKRAQSQLVQSEKLAALGQMIAGVAHEINNPLSFVSNNMAVLQRDSNALRELVRLYGQTDDVLAPHRPNILKEIGALADRIDLPYTLSNLEELLVRSRDGLKRIEQIVLDLRDFARPDETDLHEADLNAGVRSTLNIIRGRAKKQQVEMETDLMTLPPVTCYPARINQVVLNLLANALDACGEGGKVTVRTCPNQGGVEIHVLDSGPGVPSTIRDKIFDPFFTTKPVGQGTGLGLSISYRIVEDHGGRIDVDNEPGGGAHFVVHLPLKPPPLAAGRGGH